MRTGSGPVGSGDSRDPVRPAEDVTAYADELPDGLLVADESGTVVVFNSAAARITGVDVTTALGKDLTAALPLEGLDGRDWWACTDPYGTLPSVTGHPERNLLLPGGREVLVASRYVRRRPRGPVSRAWGRARCDRHLSGRE